MNGALYKARRLAHETTAGKSKVRLQSDIAQLGALLDRAIADQWPEDNRQRELNREAGDMAVKVGQLEGQVRMLTDALCRMAAVAYNAWNAKAGS